MSSSNCNENVNKEKPEEFVETFDEEEEEDNWDDMPPLASDIDSDDEVDAPLQQTVRSMNGEQKFKLASLYLVHSETDASKDDCFISLGGATHEWTTFSVHRHIALRSGVAPKKVTKGGTGVFHVEFEKPAHALKAAGGHYACGKVISTSGAALYFYRLMYQAEEVKPEHEPRIVKAFKEELGIDVVSIKVNPNKKCVSVYVKDLKTFARLLSSPFGDVVQVKGTNAFTSTYWLHSVRSCASTSFPGVGKLQISHIPAHYDEATLLLAIQDVIAPIIPRNRVLGVSIFRYADSNRNARFGFIHINGMEYAELLEKVEIPIPKSKELMYFQRATEKRKRDE